MKAEGRNGNMNAESGNAAESRSQTVGQAAAGAKLSTEQRTRITTVIRDQHVAPVTNVNFAISVGTRVPRDVAFHPLPAEIVSIYPDWRGYEFILVRDQIVVVDPRDVRDRGRPRRLISVKSTGSGAGLRSAFFPPPQASDPLRTGRRGHPPTLVNEWFPLGSTQVFIKWMRRLGATPSGPKASPGPCCYL